MNRFAFALALLLPVMAAAQTGPVEVKDVWTRATIGKPTNAAIFMTITSHLPDRLIGASTPVASRTDLMTMQGDSNAMNMAYVRAIELAPNRPVSLNPSGLHVWLAGLRQPLRAGQTFPLTLIFAKSGPRVVTVSVIAPSAMPPMEGMRM